MLLRKRKVAPCIVAYLNMWNLHDKVRCSSSAFLKSPLSIIDRFQFRQIRPPRNFVNLRCSHRSGSVIGVYHEYSNNMKRKCRPRKHQSSTEVSVTKSRSLLQLRATGEDPYDYYLAPTLQQVENSIQQNKTKAGQTMVENVGSSCLNSSPNATLGNSYSSRSFTSATNDSKNPRNAFLNAGTQSRKRESESKPYSSTSSTINPSATSTSLLIDGLATSRLGLNPLQNNRHAPMVYHERYSCPEWPENHTFPMSKFEQTAYSLLNDPDEFLSSPEDNGIEATHSINADQTPLVLSTQHFFRPLPTTTFPHSFLTPPINPIFLQKFLSASLTKEECRYIGFREQTSRPELIERTLLEVAGTVLTAQLAMKYGLASHLAGGTHHAESDVGKGFTILNDLAVSARLMTWKEGEEVTENGEDNDLLREFYRGEGTSLDRILVVDCDVHQGDGTAAFHARPDGDTISYTDDSYNGSLHERLFTLDLHASLNYPHPKATCTYDIPLPDGCNDEEYLSALTESLNQAMDEVRPQLVIYNAGVDVFHADKLGRLSLSWEGMRRRDTSVISRCVKAGIPVAAVVGGGYDKDVRELGRRHALVHRVCAQIWRENRMWEKND